MSYLQSAQDELGHRYAGVYHDGTTSLKAVKRAVYDAVDRHPNVLWVANLPENLDQQTSMTIWRNFQAAARTVKQRGGQMLFNLPLHSKWWDIPGMNSLRHELSIELAYVDWCAYGIVHEGHCVDTRTVMASTDENLLNRAARGRCSGGAPT